MMLDHAGANTPAMQKHMDKAIGDAQSFIKAHLTQRQAQVLQNARLGAEGWNDLRMLARALNDTRVREIGHMVLKEARENLFAGPGEIGRKIAQKLEGNRLQALSQEILPQHLRNALIRRWKRFERPSSEEVWKMTLDPTGETFTTLRN